jgi:copper oxidase (laccase) domain-containing protein
MAWIGPAISQACYEVGRDVLDAFLADAPPVLAAQIETCFEPRGEKYLADLAGLARERLRFLGVTAVYGGHYCTFSDAGRFHSWRRDGEAAGRQSSIICMLPPEQ